MFQKRLPGMFLRGLDWSWYYFPSWPGWWDATCSRQICRWPQIREGELSRCLSVCQDAEFGWSEPHPGTGGCQKMHKILYLVQSNLSRGTWKWLFPSHFQHPCRKRAYREDRARCFWRCIAKGLEAMVTNCSEGDPVQRQGKNIHSRRNRGLSIHPLMTCWRQLSDPA